MTDKNRRKLAAIGTTKMVDGITFTATAFMMDGEVNPNFIEWNGGARGGIIREGSASTGKVTCGSTNAPRSVKLNRFHQGPDGSPTFTPLARLSIARQRRAYDKAKALVDAFETEA